jgi:pimeloyl-ACP methyl ester carboxylesterase
MPFKRINDIDMYYEDKGDGEPLLLIHGLGSSTRDWELQVPVFSERYRVITVDLRGHGQTDKPKEPYSIKLFADDTVQLLGELHALPAHIVGLSLGGIVAFQIAVDDPAKVKSLTIINSCPEMIVHTFHELIEFWRRIIIIQLLGMRRLAVFLCGRLFPEPHQEEVRYEAVNRLAANDKRAYINTLRAISGWSVTDRLDRITCPTIIMSGDMDFLPMPTKESCVSRITNSELTIIDNSRHVTPVDQPEKFNSALNTFLSKQK